MDLQLLMGLPNLIHQGIEQSIEQGIEAIARWPSQWSNRPQTTYIKPYRKSRADPPLVGESL
jgi:hypothetical protein